MIQLSKPNITEEAIKEVSKVLQSGNLVQGAWVRRFESALQEYLSVEHAILVSSGTAALHLSGMALDIGKGDEVIVPAFTYPATANVFESLGAQSVLVDISLDDFCINPGLIENSLTEKTKAIIPVHEFGQSAKMDDIVSIAEKRGIVIIEDAACALGSEFDGQKVGTFGDIGCFSFHPRKSITTGEGGVIVTNDKSLAKKIRSLRNHGISIVNGKQDFIYAGLNYRMTDFQAALGLTQLIQIEHIIENSIRIAKNYDEYLASVDWIKAPRTIINRKSVYQTYHVLLSKEINRDELISSLKNEGIETNLGAQALSQLSYYKENYNFEFNEFPNSIEAYNQGLALPIGTHVSKQELIVICKTIINTISKCTRS